MDFDPTYDYGGTDLSNDENLLFWKFCELIKNLITLSSSAGRQREIFGFAHACDEMANDFDYYFTLPYKSYLNNTLLTVAQIVMLKDLDVYFTQRGGNKSPDFWDDSLLDSNPGWQMVREKANVILESLGMQDLTIELYQEVKYVMTEKGRQVRSQFTITRLVKIRKDFGFSSK